MSYVAGAIWIAIVNELGIPGGVFVLLLLFISFLNFYIKSKTEEPVSPEEAFLDECGFTKEEMTKELLEDARKKLKEASRSGKSIIFHTPPSQLHTL